MPSRCIHTCTHRVRPRGAPRASATHSAPGHTSGHVHALPRLRRSVDLRLEHRRRHRRAPDGARSHRLTWARRPEHGRRRPRHMRRQAASVAASRAVRPRREVAEALLVESTRARRGHRRPRSGGRVSEHASTHVDSTRARRRALRSSATRSAASVAICTARLPQRPASEGSTGP